MRRVLAVVLAALLVLGGAGMAVASGEPALSAHGPTSVRGTDASAVFKVGDRSIRQVRYRDRGTLVYAFALRNDGRLPVTVTGVAPDRVEPRLFRVLGVRDAEGAGRFTIQSGAQVGIEVRLLMHSCETLSARAGSFATSVVLRTERAGVLEDDVTVAFPEEVHTGSPREASCPNATATSRPPG